jgi:hypothetical protein
MDQIKNKKVTTRKFKKDATHLFLQGPHLASDAIKPIQAKQEN